MTFSYYWVNFVVGWGVEAKVAAWESGTEKGRGGNSVGWMRLGSNQFRLVKNQVI